MKALLACWAVRAGLATLAWSALVCAQPVDEQILALMKRAKEDQVAGKMAGAIEAYSNVLRIRPTWGPAEFNLGLVYHQQKRYQDSVPLFIRALRHDPSLESAWLFRGIGEFNLGYTRRALDSLQRFVRVRPADPQGRFFLAGVYFALEDYANAALEYIEQLRTTPDRDKVLYQLGECYLALARKQAKRLANAPDGKTCGHQFSP